MKEPIEVDFEGAREPRFLALFSRSMLRLMLRRREAVLDDLELDVLGRVASDDSVLDEERWKGLKVMTFSSVVSIVIVYPMVSCRVGVLRL